MDKEIIDLIISKVDEVRTLLDVVVDASANIDSEVSEKTGKEIVLDFDDTDLTNLQVSVDEAVQLLSDLSDSISVYI